MANSFIPVPKALSLHEGNIAEQWRRFKTAFSNYELATGSKLKGDDVRVAVLLSVIGDEAVDLFQTFTWQDPDDAAKLDEVLKMFETYCIPRKNILFETYKFTCRKQQEGEPIDRYLTDLRKQAENCEFTDRERRLRDQLVFGVKDDRVRERLLREADPKLQDVIEKIRANELAAAQSQEISEQKVESSYHVQKQTSRGQSRRDSPKWKTQVTCIYCGREHERNKELCPAFGKTCNACKKPNHFSSCCRSVKTRGANEVENQEEEAKMISFNVFTLASGTLTKQTKTFLVPQTGKHVTFHIDTGASCNVLPFNEYCRVTNDLEGRKLLPKKVQLKTYGGKKYVSEGAYNLSLKSQRKTHVINVHVVKLDGQPLLSLKTSEELGILRILDSDQATAAAVAEEQVIGTTKRDIITKYSNVFDGLGKLNGQYRIQIDPEVHPVVHAPRKFPVALRDDLKKHLDDLEDSGIIAKVTTPTDWVSSLMVVREPNKLRICIDPRDLNKAIKREHYQLPCVEEVATRLNKAKVFSVLDARKGFWQVELEEESSYLTTFHTPFGRYRWRRMPFGISSAPEIWQRKMHEFIEGLAGTEVIADDFLVVGCGDTYEEAVRDHDKNIEALLRKAQDANLKLNPDKLKFKLKEVPFIGHMLTQNGVQPDDRKIEAIINMPEPENEKDLRRILGMVQYLAKFLPSLSNVTTALRKLTHLNSEWTWTSEHRQALKAVKKLISTAPVLAYFDSKKEVVLQTDASEAGLGGVLLQDGRPVHFTSRAMTATEQRYAQIEKEMLAIVHACAKFDHYIYGRPQVRVDTDHKPLEVIFKKPIAGSPKRLQRMLLFLQKYQLDVRYKKGSELYIADTLSRANLASSQTENVLDVFFTEEAKVCSEVQQISLTCDIPNSLWRIQEIRDYSLADIGIQETLKHVRNGWPNEKKQVSDAAKPYFQCKEELTEDEGLLFKARRIIIPVQMRPAIMKRLHTGHIGIENTLRRAREYLYWPRMNEELKEFISRCDICNSHLPSNPREPMKSHDLPERAWQIVSTDIFHLFGYDYIVLVDHYSNFFEYDRLFQSSSAEVIKFIKKQFSRYGAAERLISDNGPQYSSQDFKQFARTWGFDHVTSSPHYPRSNGKAESTVKICKQLMTKAFDGKEDFFEALLDLRNTPDAITGLSPSQKCFGRRTRTFLPTRKDMLLPEPLPDIKEKIAAARNQQKEWYDSSTKSLPDVRVRELVRIRLPGAKRWSKGRIIRELGNRSYLINVSGKFYRRNRQAVRKCNEDAETPAPQVKKTTGESSEERMVMLPGYDPPIPHAGPDASPQPTPRRSTRIRVPTNFYKPG